MSVNLAKAFSEMRKYPDARTDRKVLKLIAEHTDDKGVSSVTRDTISNHLCILPIHVTVAVQRLVCKGILRVRNESSEKETYTIAPKYLRKNRTEEQPDPAAPATPVSVNLAASIQRLALAYINVIVAAQADDAKRYDTLAQQLNTIAAECLAEAAAAWETETQINERRGK